MQCSFGTEAAQPAGQARVLQPRPRNHSADMKGSYDCITLPPQEILWFLQIKAVHDMQPSGTGLGCKR